MKGLEYFYSSNKMERKVAVPAVGQKAIDYIKIIDTSQRFTVGRELRIFRD
jgi:hypothetical protein